MLKGRTPKDIKKYLDTFVIGQESAKRELSILLFNHVSRIYHKANQFDHLPLPPRLTGLICGPTGTGKTYMCSKSAEFIGLPFVKIDATSIVPHGYSGKDIHDLIADELYRKYNGTAEYNLINFAIVYIDEFDKITGRAQTTSSDDFKGDKQNTLLTIFEGKEFNVGRQAVNTNNMLFILSGVFKPEDSSNEVGFKGEFKDSLSVKVTHETLEKNGLIAEIVSRIHVIMQTHPLTKEMIKEILLESGESLLPQFRGLFFIGGRDLGLNDKEVDDIVEKIYKNKTYGARQMKSVLFEHLKDRIFELGQDIDYKEQLPKFDDIVSYHESPHDTEPPVEIILDPEFLYEDFRDFYDRCLRDPMTEYIYEPPWEPVLYSVDYDDADYEFSNFLDNLFQALPPEEGDRDED